MSGNILSSRSVRKIFEELTRFFNLVNSFVPKKKFVFFYDSKEVYLNNYALFSYMVENEFTKKVKIFYYMPSRFLRKKIESITNVYYVKWHLSALYYLFISKYVFVDTGSLRIKPARNQKIINLWHGTPLKSIGFMSKSVESTLPKNMMNTFTKCIISSEKFRKVFADSFNANLNQFEVMGQPRLDQLFYSYSVLSRLGIDKTKYNNIFMWMTTYRISYDGRLKHTKDENWSSTSLPILTNESDLIELNEHLKRKDNFVIIKIHQGSVFNRAYVKEYSNILLMTDEMFVGKQIQLYEILKDCTCLITDYSSVYFDYLLLDRPIIFVIPDKEAYEEINGFVFDKPEDFMPGLYIKSKEELFQHLDHNIFENLEIIEKRKTVLQYVHKYQDNNNCKRILDYCGIIK